MIILNSAIIEKREVIQTNSEVELVFNSGNNYYATDILDEFIRFLEENSFTDTLEYIYDEFNIDGLYDVFSEDNDNWIAAINWLKRDAAVFQSHDIDLEVDHDNTGNMVYRIYGEVKQLP